MKLLAVAVAAAALAGGACFPDLTPLPPCVPGYAAGHSAAVRLGAIYDDKSDYFWDGSLRADYWPTNGFPSCAGVDGLDTGAVVTFTPSKPLREFSPGCSVWLADFQPEVVQNPHLVVSNYIPFMRDVTIAAAYADGTLGGRPAYANRGLFSPSGDPNGALVPRQPPPLAVTRLIRWDGNDSAWEDGCFDAWVATPESAP